MQHLLRLALLCAIFVSTFGYVAPAYADSSFEHRVLDLTNAERARHGLGPLALSSELSNAARGHASAMATGGFFSHEGPNGSTIRTRSEAAGYHGWTFIAENIAAGQRTPEAVVSGWMNSDGHRANILSPRAIEIGIGHVDQPGSRYGNYWVQNFGARSRATPSSRGAAPGSTAPAANSNGCGFTLGFAALKNSIPDVVGGCTENVHHNPANGDGLQKTTRGLMVWRKADNFTAFTDGHRTWVSGPYGVQQRLNTERFAWEARG